MRPDASIPFGILLVTPFTPSLFSEPCRSSNFLGSFRDGDATMAVVNMTTCAERNPDFAATLDVEQGSLRAFPTTGSQLVWIEKASVDPKLQSRQSTLDDVLASLQASNSFEVADQDVFTAQPTVTGGFDVQYYSNDALLISVSPEKALEINTLLPPFWKSKLLPTEPQEYIPVPEPATQIVEDILSKLKFNPEVASIVGNISVPQIKRDIRYLTGEDESSGIISRHSFSTGAITAANWLKEQVEETGATCRLSPFLVGFAPNVICRYEAIEETTALVLVSGHYDSRGSFGSTRAPGGDDDGSGTTGVLSIARTIGRKGVKFHSNVELAFFAGEEQGLLGSRAYAGELRTAGANLTLMVQADMTAYRAPGEPMQLGLPDVIGSPAVTELVSKIAGLYSPELTIGTTSACCSDHQSFHEKGFPATQVFERAGPIADPMYHNSGDLSDREGYDFDQLFAIAKVQFATVLHAAGFEL